MSQLSYRPIVWAIVWCEISWPSVAGHLHVLEADTLDKTMCTWTTIGLLCKTNIFWAFSITSGPLHVGGPCRHVAHGVRPDVQAERRGAVFIFFKKVKFVWNLWSSGKKCFDLPQMGTSKARAKGLILTPQYRLNTSVLQLEKEFSGGKVSCNCCFA